MALPKEPRQKMINIMYLVLTAILALNVSNEVIEAFKTVDTSLQGSSKNLGLATDGVYSSLDKKLTDEQYKLQAAKWQPKAQQIKVLSAELDKYIEGLKVELKKGSNLKEDGTFKEDNLDASTRIFETGGKGEELKKKLEEYKAKVIAIDPDFKQFEATFPVSAEGVIGKEGKKKSFTASYFHMTPTVAALTILSKFQNNVKNAENTIVNYAHSKIGSVEFVYDKFAAVVGQSSNYLMPGEKMQITAGVGSFSSAAQPQITIGGAGVPINADGVAIREFTAEGGGERSVPVSVTYTKPDGTKETKSYNMKYTVGTPGGAAVMLDKMNVFYIGVDNPVTIGSPTGWDKTTVSMAGGNITGSGSKRTVRVSALGNASITVVADGKSSKFDFRVKKIPNPMFKVGSGRPRVPVVEFKNQQYCRADLENFDFDLKFSVVSATVYFNGAGFTGVQQGTISGGDLGPIKALMQKCLPGSSVTFDNVKVQGPDGVRTIDGATVQLY